MSHAPQVDTPSTTLSTIIDQEGNRHRFVEITAISIRRPAAQEGVQEGSVQLDLAVLLAETLRTLHTQISEEFNDREQIV